MFFAVVTVVASINDYWKELKLDVLLAPDRSKPEDEHEEKVIEANDTPIAKSESKVQANVIAQSQFKKLFSI